jgi:hypothetical protein
MSTLKQKEETKVHSVSHFIFYFQVLLHLQFQIKNKLKATFEIEQC